MGRMIDADALILELNKIPEYDFYEQTGSIFNYAKFLDVFTVVENAPTIEERKTGKWIIEPYDAQNDIFIHRCGTCMRVAMLGGHTTKFKFCPLCGSAMTEGEQP